MCQRLDVPEERDSHHLDVRRAVDRRRLAVPERSRPPAVNDCAVSRRLPVAAPAVRWGVVVAFATLILVASVRDPGPGPSPSFLGVPLATYLHLVAYAGLAAAVGYGLLRADGRAHLFAAGTAVCYGAAVELVQAPLPSRSASALDVLINTVGATAGAVLWWAVAPPSTDADADAGATSL